MTHGWYPTRGSEYRQDPEPGRTVRNETNGKESKVEGLVLIDPDGGSNPGYGT